jgi:hypothetical protein
MPPAALVAATQAVELLLLFVVLPFIVAALVIAFVSWRSGDGIPPVRTSEILASGVPGEAEVICVKAMGGFLDVRPMVRIDLRVRADGGASFDLEVTQSIPRAVLRELSAGDVVEVRLTADHSAGAVVLGGLPSDPDA